MAAKKSSPKKSANDGKGTKTQIAAFKKSKMKFKPTEAITKVGQKPKGLAKSKVKDRFASTAKTPVKRADSPFGNGSPLGTGFAMSNRKFKDAAVEAGSWMIPYGKGAKAINLGTKAIKGYKTGKAVRATLKTAGYLGVDSAYGKATSSLVGKKSPKGTKPRGRVRGK